jgi:predicted Fe-Mo cluster-binding NifX family protein
MKIAVPATKPQLSSPVDPRFGRAPYIIIVNSETMDFEALENPNLDNPSGAGIQLAQLIAEKGAQVVLTGSCGPNAFQTLQAADIGVIIGVAGTVEEALKRFISGQFRPGIQPNVPPHFGMSETLGSAGPGFGSGRGMERGRGRGMGFARSAGMGYGANAGPFGSSPFTSSAAQLSSDEEIKLLEGRAEVLKKQLEEINRRIKALEKKKE